MPLPQEDNLKSFVIEFGGQLKDANLAAAPADGKLIQTDLPSVDFASIVQYASKHPRVEAVHNLGDTSAGMGQCEKAVA